MIATSWRKVGGDDELCRVLDDALRAVDALKDAFRRGKRIDGEGDAKLDSKEIWCPELCRSPGTADAILLAHILDLCHVPRQDYTLTFPNCALILSHVCKRFRDIAIHLPNVWKDIQLQLPANRLSVHAARCSHPRLDFEWWDSFHRFKYIHPYYDWEELRLHFYDAFEVHSIFEFLRPQVNTPFTSLFLLSVDNFGVSLGEDEEETTEDEDHSMYDADQHTLASWQFPNLTRLEFRNILPSTALMCPNVAYFELVLDMPEEEILMWSAKDLGNLLQSMPKLATLSVKFHGSIPFNHNDVQATVDKLHLPCLNSLILSLDARPPLPIIDQLTVLSIRAGGSRGAPFLAHQREVDDWVTVIFTSRGLIRCFSAVVDFSLDVVDAQDVTHPPFTSMFSALSNVRRVSLTLPRGFEFDLAHWERSGGMVELRSLRITMPASEPWLHPTYAPFLFALSNSEHRDKFEKLELVHSSSASYQRGLKTLEKCLGDKLVWVSEEGS